MQMQSGHRNPRDLKPHPENPRENIDLADPKMIDLINDVRHRGVLQAIVITEQNTILIGHRRTAAAIEAGLDTVPVNIRQLSATEFAEDIFIAENVQRQDLSPLEEARAYQRLKAKMEKQQKKAVPLADVARRTNTALNTVSLRLAILELPDNVQQLFHRCEIPVNSSRELARLKHYPEECEKFAQRLVTRVLTGKSLNKVIADRLVALDVQDTQTKTAIRSQKLTELSQKTATVSHTPIITRESALESLHSKSRNTISLFVVEKVLESTCCSCGMQGTENVCQACPLPRFVTGLIGRSDSAEAI